MSELISKITIKEDESGRVSADSGKGPSLPASPDPVPYIRAVIVREHVNLGVRVITLDCMRNKVLAKIESVLEFMQGKGYVALKWNLSIEETEIAVTPVVIAVRVNPFLPAKPTTTTEADDNCLYCCM
jgi:hypothetical protein